MTYGESAGVWFRSGAVAVVIGGEVKKCVW